MKFTRILFAALAVFFSLQTNAQTVDEIITKHIDAMGGKDKMMSLKTLKMTGSMTVNGTDVSIVATKSHNIGSRNDIEVMGTSNYQVANNKEGWVFMPIFRMAEPEAMTPKQLAGEQAKFDLQGPFVNYKEKGNTIELKGSEKIGGADTWDLLVTYKNGVTANFYIDKATYRIAKSKAMVTANGEEKLEELVFDTYTKSADGYWFPGNVTNERGTITYSGIETNVKVEDSVFSK